LKKQEMTMMCNNDAEYLQRPLLQDVEYIITPDDVRIDCPHTKYVQVRKFQSVDKKEVMGLYLRVRELAKRHSAGISYRNHYRKGIQDYGDACLACCNIAQHVFDQVITEAENVRARGLHFGTRDDEALEQLQSTCAEYEKIFWQDSAYSKLSAIKHSLEEYLHFLNYKTSDERDVVIFL
jgi:hypothetical protein